jgi:hypothetical protein
VGWFRVDDHAIDHPKVLALSDGAFRLWVEGGSYCTRHLTDGHLSGLALRGFRYASPKRIAELRAQRLWEPTSDGFLLHDWTDWNDTAKVIKTKKEQRRLATRRWRDRASTGNHRDASQPTSQDAHGPYGMDVLSSDLPNDSDLTTTQTSEGESEGKPAKPAAFSPKNHFVDGSVTERAGRFLDRYSELYSEYCHANYLLRPHRDYQAAVPICATWTDDARLEKLVIIFLTTDHEFAASGSRTVAQFAALASWCDTRLAAWEARTGNGAGL